MRVPNPKEKKYWYKRIGSKFSREFDINRYLQDFNEWENKLLHFVGSVLGTFLALMRRLN